MIFVFLGISFDLTSSHLISYVDIWDLRPHNMLTYEISYEVPFEVIWYKMRLFETVSNKVIWYQMSSYELKWRLIWAQMTSHMSSNDTSYELKWDSSEIRKGVGFGKGWHRTAMRVCVSTLITGGVHIDHPHTTNTAWNSKRLWKFKIGIFYLIWDLKWEIEVYR